MANALQDRKLGELIVYIAAKCEGDANFGATKLNKILFFADFSAFAQRGESITGQEYMRLSHGPVPRRLLPVQNRLISAGVCVSASRSHFGRPQKRLLATRDADLSEFSGTEIAIVDDIIDQVRHLSATEISEISHRFDGWKLAADQETIPYETVCLGGRGLSERDKRHALELAASRG